MQKYPKWVAHATLPPGEGGRVWGRYGFGQGRVASKRGFQPCAVSGPAVLYEDVAGGREGWPSLNPPC